MVVVNVVQASLGPVGVDSYQVSVIAISKDCLFRGRLTKPTVIHGIYSTIPSMTISRQLWSTRALQTCPQML